ncbi:fatty acid hydroxylase [Mycena maculata]|uniref:Fatty acid hydroxylase n=1 Tax=Mycena maculata TaxID=230809 RepID=A0AAD7N1Q0_9AGAR|nr:fatty acid hydroxylase [Mycena maculata]
MSVPIPQPPTIPFLGNVASLDREVPLRSFDLLAKKYGEIYQLNMLGNNLIVASSHALTNEVSDEARFQKRVTGGLAQVRNLVGDGLFTGMAHRLLMPAFGTIAVKGMMEEMRDISNQLLLKWERFGPERVIDPSEDFTRVALDAIAYCSMSYRLNSFYTEQQPEFTIAMGDFLAESGARARRPCVLQAVMLGTSAKYEADIKTMRDLAEQIVSTRKAHPIPKHDLLDTMLNSRDPKTGQAMSEESISQNLLTFLNPGHETSSGMMTFMVYYLLKNPETMRTLRAQVDTVLGERPIQYEDFDKLPYLIAVMHEALRLAPTAPMRSTMSLEDTTIGGGKYAIKKGAGIAISVWSMHRDPAVWGEDAEEFRPERMLDGKFEALPPNAWQPGAPDAHLRGKNLVMASIIQKFDLALDYPLYTLQIKQTLTVKPKGLRIHATPRAGGVHLYATPSSTLLTNRDAAPGPKVDAPAAGAGVPFYVLYGSNTGTSEAFAQRIANEAPSYGFRPSIGTLDSAVGKVPKDGPVVIVTASFEGEPADNAARFIDYLRHIEGNELENVRFAVFGCGSSDWTATFQKIPIVCDELFERHGGHRLVARGSGDAGKGDFFQTFDDWEAGLWVTPLKEYVTSRAEGLAPTLEITTVDAGKERSAALRQADTLLGRVVENLVLTKDGPVKRHIEFELPEGTTARAGDYVAILPQNPIRDVRRVLARFGLSNEEEVILSSAGPTSLPLGKPVKLAEILSGYIELSQLATTKDLGVLAEAATTEATRAYLEELKASYSDTVLAKRLSVFEILETHGDITLSGGAFVQMMPSMRVRQYSISSSPLWNPSHITVTVSVLDAPSLTGKAAQPFLGMAVRPSAAAFHPPENPTTPVVMFCSGSGLAPMRGFIQQRAAQKASGREVGSMLLFFGCHAPQTDYLYADSDLAEWTKLGVVDVRPAFSRSSSDSEGCKYVQHRVWKDNADVVEAYRKGAAFLTCGSANVAKGVKATLVDIIKAEENVDVVRAEKMFSKIMKGWYATDIFD